MKVWYFLLDVYHCAAYTLREARMAWKRAWFMLRGTQPQLDDVLY